MPAHAQSVSGPLPENVCKVSGEQDACKEDQKSEGELAYGYRVFADVPEFSLPEP